MIQILIWVCIILVPTAVGLSISGFKAAGHVFEGTVRMILPLLALYYINYLWLVPKFLFGKDRKWFYIVNILLLIGWNLYKFIPRQPMPQEVLDQFGGDDKMWMMYAIAISFHVLFQVMIILFAVGVRSLLRNSELRMQIEEEKRKTTEAELVWLKNQLNPHFLFNTLNNISSLTQIDPDKAQDSIGQLSDLLRYALYESEAEKVQLTSELEFMDNYIDLITLRCNDLTTVRKDLRKPSKPVEVAPLLFISLVENAFKHGVNARYPSSVDISMGMEGDDLVFICENSLFEKQGTDRIGSGIGLENLKRRLELIYPGKYTYEQTSDEKSYRVRVVLKGL